MSINSISGINSFNYGAMPSDPIKPETREKLKALGIDAKDIKSEKQAQQKIEAKEEEIKKAIQERLQAEASQNIQVQSQQATQNTQAVQPNEKIDGVKESQQVKQPESIENQQNVQHQQTGNEQMKAFASSNTAIAQQIQPFDMSSDLIAMHNKLKLGLI